MDIPLTLLVLLLAATLAGWATGLLVYPFGLLVLSMMIVARLLHLRGKHTDRDQNTNR